MNKKKIYLIGTVTCLFFTVCTLDTVPTDKYGRKISGRIPDRFRPDLLLVTVRCTTLICMVLC